MKSLKQAKDHFTQAIELDPSYLKPLYQRMCILKADKEYEDALADAIKISKLDKGFPGIGITII